MHFTQLIEGRMLLPVTPGDDLAWVGDGVKTNNIESKLFMANQNERLPENAPGAWYVDRGCIDCDMCRETAPAIFARNGDIGFSVVIHQPRNETELKAAREAQAVCPADAIGDDGSTS